MAAPCVLVCDGSGSHDAPSAGLEPASLPAGILHSPHVMMESPSGERTVCLAQLPTAVFGRHSSQLDGGVSPARSYACTNDLLGPRHRNMGPSAAALRSSVQVGADVEPPFELPLAPAHSSFVLEPADRTHSEGWQ